MIKNEIQKLYNTGMLHTIIELYNDNELYKYTNDNYFKLDNEESDNEEIDDKIISYILTDNDKYEIYCYILENLYHFVEDNPTIYCEKTWKENLINYIEILCEEYDEYLYNIKTINVNHIEYIDIDEILELFYHIVPKRSCINNDIIVSVDKEKIKKKIEIIDEKDKSQPEQRTEEWFKRRYDIISASVAWKGIDTIASVNSLIVSKCKPLDLNKYKFTNMNSPMHWGQKYEPISQMYYEDKYNVKVKEYGCIPHTKYNFLGASPDGIIVTENSERYGRMLEIKNIVNREINGIPKKDYWVQTQMQMECCDLDECDFLECKINEYENEKEFLSDGDGIHKTENGNRKGIILLFFDENRPHYEYHPFNNNDFDLWFNEKINENNDKMFSHKIYWRMDKVSCVLIERNKLWFNSIVDSLNDVWKIILKERKEGYEHRLPKKTNKTHKSEVPSIIMTDELIQYKNKIVGKSESKSKSKKIITNENNEIPIIIMSDDLKNYKKPIKKQKQKKKDDVIVININI
jgi:putative phage-type endonuclease